MTLSDYNDLILNNTTITDTLCPSCKNLAELKYTRVKDVDPEIMLVVFECKSCNIKDTQFFNENTNAKKLVIECHFTDKDDLKREVNLNMHTQLFIEYGDIKYEHESSLPCVITVEGLIDQAIDALSNDSSAVFGDKDELLKAVDKLQLLKDDPLFYMRIEDNDGSSRVGLVDRGVYEMQGCSLEEFNDEKVFHSLL